MCERAGNYCIMYIKGKMHTTLHHRTAQKTPSSLFSILLCGAILGIVVTGTLVQAKSLWIRDDRDAGGYVEQGNWKTVRRVGYKKSERVVEAKTGATISARWTFTSVPPGTYDVYVTWQVADLPDAEPDSEATYTLFEQKKKVTSVFLDQGENPHGITHKKVQWQKMGNWHFTRPAITVELTPSVPGRSVFADAVLLYRSPMSSSKKALSSSPGHTGTGGVAVPRARTGSTVSSSLSSSSRDTIPVTPSPTPSPTLPPQAASGAFLPAPPNTTTTLTVERQAGTNDRYVLWIRDPNPSGIRKEVLRGADGRDLGGGNGDCPGVAAYGGGVGVTLQPSDFPVRAYITNCAGQQFVLQANMPPLVAPVSSGGASSSFSSASVASSTGSIISSHSASSGPSAVSSINEWPSRNCATLKSQANSSAGNGTATAYAQAYGMFLCTVGQERALDLEQPYSDVNFPKMSGENLIYRKGYGLVLYNLNSSQKTTIEGPSGGVDQIPAIEGIYVLYDRNGGLVLYRIDTQQKTDIEPANSGAKYPAISGRYVGYGFGSSGIRLFNIETNAKTDVEPATSGCYNAVFDGNTLTYNCSGTKRTYQLP